MSKENSLTAEMLRAAFDYAPLTGRFTRRHGCRGHAAGIAGRVDGAGYVRIGFMRKFFSAHRLAWLYVYGNWPRGALDHINRVRDDNRIANLREATPAENVWNRLKPSCGSNRLIGATFHRGKWQATISHEYLGRFDTEEEAHNCYMAAKVTRHPLCPASLPHLQEQAEESDV